MHTEANLLVAIWKSFLVKTVTVKPVIIGTDTVKHKLRRF